MAWALGPHTWRQGGSLGFMQIRAGMLRSDYWKDFLPRKWVASHARVSSCWRVGTAQATERGQPLFILLPPQL